MSYCRFSAGDVYVYYDVRHGLTCCACRLRPTPEWYEDVITGDDRLAMIDHLKDHRRHNHIVPDYAIRRLEDEDRELFYCDICNRRVRDKKRHDAHKHPKKKGARR